MTFFGDKRMVLCTLAKTGLTLRPHFLSLANPHPGWAISYLLPTLYQPQQPPPWRGCQARLINTA